jgi:hypothetical protein
MSDEFDEIGKPVKAAKRLHPLLTNEEVLSAKKRARDKLEADQKAFAMKDIEAAELARLKSEERQVVGGVMDELVNLTVDLPEFGSCLVTNMRPFWHGHTYLVPRHVATDLASRMQAMWQHQYREIDGKKMSEFYRRHRGTIMSPNGVANSPALPV